jgi:hypothetical protein
MTGPAVPTVPAFDHIFVVLMENHSSAQIIGSADAPWGLAPLTENDAGDRDERLLRGRLAPGPRGSTAVPREPAVRSGK